MNKTKVFFYVMIILMLLQTVEAKKIEFKYNYQDYIGNWYTYNNENLASHPYYTIIDNGTNYTISRTGTTINLPKRTWIDYEFYPDRINPVVTIQNYSQINGLVTKENSTSWYLSTHWSSSQVKSVTDYLIDMEVFERTLDFTVSDSNITCGEACPSYSIVPKVIGGEIRLYFNPQTYSEVVWPLKITENTITVSNATTQGWSISNVSLNGSRFTGDGKLAINLEPQYLTNLTCYWGMDETQGTIIRGINATSNGLPASVCQGIWNGGLLNSTIGDIGKAIIFNTTSSNYIDILNNIRFNLTAPTIYVIFKTNDTLFNYAIVSKRGTNRGYTLTYRGDLSDGVRFIKGNGTAIETLTSSNNAITSTGLFYKIFFNLTPEVKYNFFINNSAWGSGTSAYPIVYDSTSFRIGQTQNANYCNCTIDELVIWDGIAPNQNILFSRSTIPFFSNQTANTSNQINKVRINYTGQDLINNASIFANKTSVIGRILIQSNVTSGIYYDIPLSLQNQTMDFAVEFAGNGSNTIFFESLEWDETPSPTATPTPIPTPIPNCGLNLILNNTNLAPTIEPDHPGTGERTNATTYYNNDSTIQLIVFAHAQSVSEVAGTFIYINNTLVMGQSGRPLGGAEVSYRGSPILVPKGSYYRVEFFDFHHYEWREYKMDLDISGCNYPNNNSSLNEVIITYALLVSLICELLAIAWCCKKLRKKKCNEKY